MTKTRLIADSANNNTIDGDRLVDGSVSNDKLESGIDGAKLSDGSVPLSKLSTEEAIDANSVEYTGNFPDSQTHSVGDRLNYSAYADDFIPELNSSGDPFNTEIDDCSPYIQKAFDWLVAAGGRKLSFSSGKIYLCKSTLNVTKNLSINLVGSTIDGNGARLNFDLSQESDPLRRRYGLLLDISLANKLWRVWTLRGLRIGGNYTEYALVVNGGGNSPEFSYGFLIERMDITGHTALIGNLFEGTVEHNFLAANRGSEQDVIDSGSPDAYEPKKQQSVIFISDSGPILSLASSTLTGGTGYLPGLYPNTPLTGGFGQGATANITVGPSGSVTNVILNNSGDNYAVEDILGADMTAAGAGNGSGFSIEVETLQRQGMISSITINQNMFRGGFNSCRLTQGTNDVSFTGNTFLLSWEHALVYRTTTGVSLDHIHIENCWVRYPGKWGGASSSFYDHTGSKITDGAPISSASLSANTWYKIETVGDTDWVSIGAPSNTTGVIFEATGGASGSGIASSNAWANWYYTATTAQRNTVIRRSGMRLICSGSSSSVNATKQVANATNNGGTMSTVDVFASGSSPVFSANGANGMATCICVSGNGAVMIFGSSTEWLKVGNYPKVTTIGKGRIKPAVASAIHRKTMGGSTYTPFSTDGTISMNNLLASSYCITLTQALSINAPNTNEYTPSYGDEIKFVFEQDSSGGHLISWDPIYITNGFTPRSVPAMISAISFRYMEVNSVDRWVEFSSSF